MHAQNQAVKQAVHYSTSPVAEAKIIGKQTVGLHADRVQALPSAIAGTHPSVQPVAKPLPNVVPADIFFSKLKHDTTISIVIAVVAVTLATLLNIGILYLVDNLDTQPVNNSVTELIR